MDHSINPEGANVRKREVGDVNIWTAKQLAHSMSTDIQVCAKRLCVMNEICERNEQTQRRCREYLEDIWSEVHGADNDSGMKLRDELTRSLLKMSDDTLRMELNQHEILDFMNIFKVDIEQQISTRFDGFQKEVESLKNHVNDLKDEVVKVRTNINRFNAIVHRLSRAPMPTMANCGE